MKKFVLTLAVVLTAITINAKTLIVYYSFTNNVHTIATDLQSQTGADMVRIEPSAGLCRQQLCHRQRTHLGNPQQSR